MKNQITCRNCGLIDDYHIEIKGKHHTAICNGCGKYIKHLPHSEPTLYFGKYKFQKVCDITDLDYLQWVWDNVELSKSLREAIDLQIQKLYKTA